MATVNQMTDLAKKVFAFDFNLYVFNRLWHKQDFHDLAKYEVLSVASLLYILSDEEKRSLITDALGENLEIEDPENAVKYMILHELNSVSAARMLFHRISYTSGIILNNTVSEALSKSLPGLYLTAAEMYLFSTVATSPSEMSLTLATLTLRLWVDCQVNNLRNADEECEPFHDSMTWPSLDEFIDIIHENELVFDSYESMGDPALDKIGRPICDYFLKMVTDGFASFAKESNYPGFYIPFEDAEYAEALERYHFILEYTAEYGTYTDDFKQEEDSLDGIVKKIFALTDELTPLMKEDDSFSSITLRDAAQLSMLKIFLYLTASDEYISGKEVRAINDSLGYRFTKDQIQKLIKDQNIYTVTFENETPPVMRFLMQFDRALAEKGYAANASHTKQFVDLCEKAGMLFIGCDGSANDDEKRDLQTIIAKYKRLTDMLEQDIKKYE